VSLIWKAWPGSKPPVLLPHDAAAAPPPAPHAPASPDGLLPAVPSPPPLQGSDRATARCLAPCAAAASAGWYRAVLMGVLLAPLGGWGPETAQQWRPCCCRRCGGAQHQPADHQQASATAAAAANGALLGGVAAQPGGDAAVRRGRPSCRGGCPRQQTPMPLAHNTLRGQSAGSAALPGAVGWCSVGRHAPCLAGQSVQRVAGRMLFLKHTGVPARELSRACLLL
jgi:hypothetical protein